MRYAQGSFITVPSREKLRGLHPTAQALYMWLCSYANETGNCFPARKRLSEDVGCSESMIDNMLSLLIREGLLIKQNRRDGDTQLSNLYTVIVSPPLAHSGTPPSTEYATPSHDVRTNSNQLTQTKELKLVRLNALGEEITQKRVRSNDLPGFLEFSSRYPKKVNKANASAIWNKLSVEERCLANTDVEERNTKNLWGEYKFIPNMASYLEGRRWEDEPSKPKVEEIMRFGKAK